MKVEFVQPVAVQDDPIFRVRLWTPPARDGFAWSVDDWELTECDLDEVLDWARQRSDGNLLRDGNNRRSVPLASIGTSTSQRALTYLSFSPVNRLRSRSSHPAASGKARDQPN